MSLCYLVVFLNKHSSWLLSFCHFQNGRRPLLQLLHPNCPRYFSPDDLASLDLSIPSLCTKANAKLFYFFVKLANDAAASLKLNESFFPLYQGGLEVNSDLDKPVKSAKVGQDVEEDNSDTEDVTTESDKRTNEGGKKDPFLRRQELLVNSGLAEVGIHCTFACIYFLFLHSCSLEDLCYSSSFIKDVSCQLFATNQF